MKHHCKTFTIDRSVWSIFSICVRLFRWMWKFKSISYQWRRQQRSKITSNACWHVMLNHFTKAFFLRHTYTPAKPLIIYVSHAPNWLFSTAYQHTHTTTKKYHMLILHCNVYRIIIIISSLKQHGIEMRWCLEWKLFTLFPFHKKNHRTYTLFICLIE